MTPLVLLLSLTVGAATANEPRKLDSLFSHRAGVSVSQPGPHALELSTAVLTECRADWGDLRLVNQQGIEVPYWLDNGNVRPPPPVAVEQSTLKSVTRRELKKDGLPSTFEETLTLSTPVSTDDHWWLVLDTSVAAFVAELEWAWVRQGKPGPTHSVSVFRLADGRAQTRVELEGAVADGLRITLRGENGRYLEPRFHYRREPFTIDRSLMPLQAEPASQTNSNGITTLTMNRREGWRESELRFETTTPAFSRRVRIYELRDNQPRALVGAGTISRLLAGLSTGEGMRGRASTSNVEHLAILLAPARGERLEVEIENGDSPPLNDLKVTPYALVPRLLFMASAEHVGSSQKLTLLFGSNRVTKPVYDVIQLDNEQVGTQFAKAPFAQLGDVSANGVYDASPLLQYAWTPGAVVETSGFSHRVPIHIAHSPSGVARLPLPVDVVARARADLADVRIIDEKARQIPYMRLSTAFAPEWVPLTMSPGTKESSDTLIKLRGAQGAVPWRRLRLTISTQFVERPFSVQGLSAEGKPVPLTAGTLSRANDSAAHLEIELPNIAVTELELRLKEGDAAPLQISAVEGETALPMLHVLAPPGAYSLLVGQPGAIAPQYQLESLRELVSQLEAPAVQLGGTLSDNPDFTRLSRLRQGGTTERAAVWAALGLGVLVLGAFTLRLLRKAPVEGPPPSA